MSDADKVDEAFLEALVTNICRHCMLHIKLHLGKKCPFEATDFVQMTKEELCAYNEKFWEMIPIQGLKK